MESVLFCDNFCFDVTITGNPCGSSGRSYQKRMPRKRSYIANLSLQLRLAPAETQRGLLRTPRISTPASIAFLSSKLALCLRLPVPRPSRPRTLTGTAATVAYLTAGTRYLYEARLHLTQSRAQSPIMKVVESSRCCAGVINHVLYSPGSLREGFRRNSSLSPTGTTKQVQLTPSGRRPSPSHQGGRVWPTVLDGVETSDRA